MLKNSNVIDPTGSFGCGNPKARTIFSSPPLTTRASTESPLLE